ncbi:MAG: phosphoenolpyruvate carboxylase, partial [Alcaligenaceae bacterium]|nr:phosphoenolpyruvate carboxylase [Alcaligenaceae bacterium]
YGVGTALSRYIDEGCLGAPNTAPKRLAELQAMARDWPFFRTLLSNMEQVLAKTDLAIGRTYAELVPDKRLRDTVFGRIQDEYLRTVEAFRQITGHELLEQDEQLRAALSERFAYIDPLNHLQAELLRRHRTSQPSDRQDNTGETRSQRAIHMTINGIAAGLRNSG